MMNIEDQHPFVLIQVPKLKKIDLKRSKVFNIQFVTNVTDLTRRTQRGNEERGYSRFEHPPIVVADIICNSSPEYVWGNPFETCVRIACEKQGLV